MSNTYHFGGYATKNDLKCRDGRTIRAGAFADCDGQTVPLVWHHRHDGPENVLGHAMLEERDDGMYCYAVFNDSPNGQQAKALVEHGDIDSLSIHANDLVHKGSDVLHGVIREVSLVLAGANPGAKIDNIAISHADGYDEELDDEAIIHTGLFLEEPDELNHFGVLGMKWGVRRYQNADGSLTPKGKARAGKKYDKNLKKNFANIHNSTAGVFNEKIGAINKKYDKFDFSEKGQRDSKNAKAYEKYTAEVEKMYDEEFSKAAESFLGKDPRKLNHSDDDGPSLEEVVESFDEDQMAAVEYLVGAALEEALGEDDDPGDNDNEEDEEIEHGGLTVKKNVFEANAIQHDAVSKPKLTKEQLSEIVEDAKKCGSFKESFLQHAGDYGIDNIEILFPEAKATTNEPTFIQRRMEWVPKVIGGVKKSPFARIKMIHADITADEARAKGYLKGNKKFEEVFPLLSRKVEPTTIYKKQKLDRDDIIDITDLDVVAWLKREMRIMLDEEIARAILFGDGRTVTHQDKIDDTKLIPIIKEPDLYAIKYIIPADTEPEDFIDEVVKSRLDYRGSGSPSMFIGSKPLTDMMLLKDKIGHRIYKTEAELAAAMRVSDITEIDLMNDHTVEHEGTEYALRSIIVNLNDYQLGANKGGEVSFFDDFDIDYNQFKYLMETRMSGALTLPFSAIVILQEIAG